MNKKQLIQAAWIPIKKRMPPDTPDEIWAWNSHLDKSFITDGQILRMQMANADDPAIKKVLDKTEMSGSPVDYHRTVTHWMKIYGPGE